MSAVWFVDRSRITTGTDHCNMARYYKYHYGGYGIELKQPGLEPFVGIAVHNMLGPALLKGEIDSEAVLTWAERIGRICEIRQEPQHTMQEQQFLAACLALGWWRALKDWFYDTYEVVAIEPEYSMPLDGGRMLLSVRPDMVLRDKQTKQLVMGDLKTMSYFDEDTTSAEYRDNVQMALTTAVMEHCLKEPVPSYRIFGLLKGSRKHFTKDKQKTDERRQYSSLCYATPPDPPFRKEWKTSGYWYNKAPVWKHLAAPEWVELFPLEELQAMFPVIGPYPRPTHMIDQCLRGLVGEENRWIEAIWKVREDAANLDRAISRSYGHCTSWYGAECPYYRLCYKLQGWEDPLSSGYYKPRRPHHEPELKAMQEAGYPVPPEPWETEETK
jgi:hypothetical protein